MRERFLLDTPGWFAKAEPTAALPIVAAAVWSGRRLDLRYGEKGARRRVEPLGLVLKAGTWYVVARHRGELRSYRVSRIASARLRSDEGFERPEGFSLGSWWREAQAAFDRSLLRFRCELRLSPSGFRLLPHVVPNEAVPAMLREAGPPDDDGWRAVPLWLESERVALSQLVALGDAVEVLAPLSLRRALAEVGAAMARRNEVGS